MSLKAVFLDREGVITPKLGQGEFLLTDSQATVDPAAIEGLRKLQDSGCKLFIVSNQSCVSRGMISQGEVERLHQLLLGKLSEAGINFVDSRICPHVDADNCTCRKPKPGMILELCEQHDIKPEESIMIGDSQTDLEAGKNAGCAANINISDRPHQEFATCKDLSEAADWIMNSNLWKQK